MTREMAHYAIQVVGSIALPCRGRVQNVLQKLKHGIIPYGPSILADH